MEQTVMVEYYDGLTHTDVEVGTRFVDHDETSTLREGGSSPLSYGAGVRPPRNWRLVGVDRLDSTTIASQLINHAFNLFERTADRSTAAARKSVLDSETSEFLV
jgi:hypothetical protein